MAEKIPNSRKKTKCRLLFSNHFCLPGAPDPVFIQFNARWPRKARFMPKKANIKYQLYIKETVKSTSTLFIYFLSFASTSFFLLFQVREACQVIKQSTGN